MLDEYKMPKHFWPEAVETACHATNRLYLHKILGKTADNPQVQGITVAISKGGSDKYGVSNPQELKIRSILSQALSATDTTLRTPNVCFQLETRNKTTLWV